MITTKGLQQQQHAIAIGIGIGIDEKTSILGTEVRIASGWVDMLDSLSITNRQPGRAVDWCLDGNSLTLSMTTTPRMYSS